MFGKIRPFIFKFDPETAHNLAIQALKFNLMPRNQKQNFKHVETEIFNKKIPNPIGLAAGFDKDAEVYNSIFRLGFGFVEVGTITPLKQSGNPKPRVFRLEEDEALINRLGFNNSGADLIQSRIRLNPPKGLFGINIGPNKDTKDRINDYLIGLRKFYELADYLTINISSPNTENLRSFHNESELNDLLQAIEQEKASLKTSIPTVLKISPDINDQEIEKISKLILKYNIPAIIVSLIDGPLVGRHFFRCLSWDKSGHGMAACCVCYTYGAEAFRDAKSTNTFSGRSFIGNDCHIGTFLNYDLAN